MTGPPPLILTRAEHLRQRGLAGDNQELVELARKLANRLSEAQREALEGHLRALLELTQAK